MPNTDGEESEMVKEMIQSSGDTRGGGENVSTTEYGGNGRDNVATSREEGQSQMDRNLTDPINTQLKSAHMKTPEPGEHTPFSDEGDELLSFSPSEMSERHTPVLTDGKGDVEDDDSGWDTDLDIETEETKEVYDATGKNVYMQACKEAGVVPVSHILRHITTNKIIMKHHGLGPAGAKAIAVPLVTNTTVLTLDLEDNWIEGDGASYLADMLKENCYISDLNLAENRMGSKGAKAMSDMLVDNTSIRKLNLAGNNFKDRDAEYFLEAVKNNYRIRDLNLSHNEFAEIGGEILGAAIAATESLSHLNLSWNHLRRKGAIAVCRGMAENLSIKELNLSWNGLGNEGSLAMAETLKFNSTLQELDMTNNRITNEGALVMSKGLEVNDSLKVLRFGYNPLTAAGAMALLLAIKNNSNSALELLDLSEVVINSDCVAVLEEIQQMRSNFEMLHKGAVGKFAKPPVEEVDPVKVLHTYIESKNMRVWDLFRAYDKDKSMTVSHEEFKKGIEASGIPLKPRAINRLIDMLDKDGDGEIDYSELVSGQKDLVAANRQERRDQMTRISDSRKTAIYKPVVEQYSNLKISSLRQSLSPDRKMKVNETIRPDVKTWDEFGHRAEEVNEAVRSLDNTVDFITSAGTKYSKEEDFLLKTMDPARPRSARSPTPVHAMVDQSRGRSATKKSATKK
ncbi:uncharacterized protein [Amphiura filiformis]|uniref:uncharacterized protein n=1 Tax=Amphiura filiformis TaxID=82378 RepID=UPI003B20BE35